MWNYQSDKRCIQVCYLYFKSFLFHFTKSLDLSSIFHIHMVYCFVCIISIIRKVSAASGRRGGIERCLFFVDAVHYAPHHVLDVQDIGCDFCVCSPFKFFGPHTGINI